MTSIWELPNVYFQNLLLINNTPDNILHLKCISVHSHAHSLSKNWLSQHIFKKQILNWRKWPQFESCQMYIFKMYSSPAIQWRITFNLKCIFVYSHAHPLSKNLLSQHIFKKQISNWRKWPQFESCQMNIFKIYSSSTIHPTITFNLKCISVHSHAHSLSKNWLSQHIFKKQILNWRKWPQFESCQMYIFKIYSSQQYSGEQPSTSNAYLSTPMHTLWAKICWVSIFLKNRFQIDANDLNLRVANTSNWQCVYFQNVLLTSNTTFNLKCIFVYSHAHPLSKNLLSQHIFKKQISSDSNANWRKWPQFESCQMYIFKMYSSPAIQWRTTFNLKCIFVYSHAHSLSKNWLSQHIFKKQISNWRKWPQFESCQMYIFKMYSSPAIQWRTTFNLKCIFVYSHAHSLSKNWLSQHIFKKQISNWRKWPQFESCQMYIFKIYSSSTIHQTTTFNLKCISVHSHAPLSKNWLSQHIFKKQIQIDANDLNLRVAKCIFSKSTPHQQYSGE